MFPRIAFLTLPEEEVLFPCILPSNRAAVLLASLDTLSSLEGVFSTMTLLMDSLLFYFTRTI